MTISKGAFRHVESELYAYHETRKEIVRLKNEVLYGSASMDENVGGGRSNLPGDPTGRTAVMLVSHRKIEQLERIIDSVESVVSQLPEKKRQLMQMRYWARPQTLTWDGIAQKVERDRATLIRWRNEIVKEIANRIGWR